MKFTPAARSGVGRLWLTFQALTDLAIDSRPFGPKGKVFCLL